jgi:uncharacterized protein (TIGR02145 family)
MKKLYFYVLLLLLWGAGGFSFAQSHINIEMLGTTYTVPPAVQFRVSWNNVPASGCHNTKIWLWVDFVKIKNAAPLGNWSRATVANPSAGTVVPGNDKGFWLQGSAPSYSETVTVELTNVSGEFNWCTYASDCPPSANLEEAYRLHGTPPFELTAESGDTQTVNGNALFVSDMTGIPVTITDATGCPASLCPYTGRDLYIDATHLCQQRVSGAKNWEAWIKDTRDNEYYRIVLMPDNKWWLAQNVKYAGKGQAPNWCGKDECGRIYTTDEMRNGQSATGNITGICPDGWLIPVVADMSNMVDSVRAQGVRVTTLTTYHSVCGLVGDYFGWADLKNVYAGTGGTAENKNGPDFASKHANDAKYTCRGLYFTCDDYAGININASCGATPVRCFHQL